MDPLGATEKVPELQPRLFTTMPHSPEYESALHSHIGLRASRSEGRGECSLV